MSKSISSVVDAVHSAARKVAKRITQEFPAAASPGDAVRQGDIYIALLASIPRGCKAIDKPSRQVAPGTGQGSRHVLDRDVRQYAVKDSDEFTGPVLQCEEITTLTHPEHGDWTLPPGLYQISYQRTQDALDQQRRVQD